MSGPHLFDALIVALGPLNIPIVTRDHLAGLFGDTHVELRYLGFFDLNRFIKLVIQPNVLYLLPVALIHSYNILILGQWHKITLSQPFKGLLSEVSKPVEMIFGAQLFVVLNIAHVQGRGRVIDLAGYIVVAQNLVG